MHHSYCWIWADLEKIINNTFIPGDSRIQLWKLMFWALTVWHPSSSLNAYFIHHIHMKKVTGFWKKKKGKKEAIKSMIVGFQEYFKKIYLKTWVFSCARKSDCLLQGKYLIRHLYGWWPYDSIVFQVFFTWIIITS